MRILFILIILFANLFSQDVIDISVKGVSNEKNDGTQKDRFEAILDAKRQACEKAGLKIESKTTVENFQVVYDFIESKAETILLPGFQIIDIGYVQDGTYQVVLSGKIKITEEEEQISSKELRYAKSLKDRGKHSQCEAILKKYIDNTDKDVSDELKEEAFYFFIKWGYSWNVEESCHKFASYYPQSKHVLKIEQFGKFAAKPLYIHSRKYNPTPKDWIKTEFIHKDVTYKKQILVTNETIVFKDFKQNDKSLIIEYTLFKSDDDDKKAYTAYKIIINYFNGNYLTYDSNKIKPEDLVKVYERSKAFKPNITPTFQFSTSGAWFNNFKLKNFELSGKIPVGESPFTQELEFKVYQKSF